VLCWLAGDGPRTPDKEGEMKRVDPQVLLVARPEVDYEAVAAYLREVGGESWLERLDRDQLDNDAQNLAEFAGATAPGSRA
jgi:hypothetical protein